MSTYSSARIFLVSFGGISARPDSELLLHWPSVMPVDNRGAVDDVALGVSSWDSAADVDASNALLGVPEKVGRSESRVGSGIEPSTPMG